MDARISDRREMSGCHAPKPIIPPRPTMKINIIGVWGVGGGFGGRGGRGGGADRPHAGAKRRLMPGGFPLFNLFPFIISR